MKIYFDMDGVLADFDRFVTENCGMTLTAEGRQPGGKEEMWRRAREIPHFYGCFEMMPGAKELFDAVYRRYGEDCEILTGIPHPQYGINTADEDKRAWTKRLLSDKIVVNTVYKEEKPRFCTGADCILIDDLPLNIEGRRAAGGTGILFESAEQTLEQLREMGLL